MTIPYQQQGRPNPNQEPQRTRVEFEKSRDCGHTHSAIGYGIMRGIKIILPEDASPEDVLRAAKKRYPAMFARL